MGLTRLLLPTAAAITVALVVGAVHRRVHPRIAARMLIAVLVVTASAAVPTVLIVELAFLAHLPVIGAGFEWCAKAFGMHQQIPPVIGLPFLVLSIAGIVRSRRVIRAFREMRCQIGDEIEVCDRSEAFAVTLPGRAGQIVVSSGLLELLDQPETDVVLAHERAHAGHRHDRYLFAARLANAALPILRPLAKRLEFTLERWADEDAVRTVGDRSFVARTLGKVALASVAHQSVALAVTGLGVPARVGALLAPAPPPATRPLIAATWGLIAATAGLAAIQLHHLASLLIALCPG